MKLKDKLPAAPLFSDHKGRPWNSDSWNKATKLAAEKAKLPASITLYCLRNSRITDLVEAGLPVLAIARLAGISEHIINKH